VIALCHGDIFDSGAEALVVPVNCVGVSGAGLAKQFKERYPSWFHEYARACKENKLWPGHPWLYWPGKVAGSLAIVSFPTKYHYSDPSNLKWIEAGMWRLVGEVLALKLSSIAIPALGCGLGGLKWGEVWRIMSGPCHAMDEQDVQCLVYAPREAAREMIRQGGDSRSDS
jgi:O-acetyl-ADP-ribose deacetylase (regulator of RNase III)